ELMRRQSVLESRATALNGGVDPATTGSIRPGTKPSGEPAAGSQRGDRGRQSSIGAAVGRLEAALDQMERRQALAFSQMQDRYENKARAIRSALAQLGLKSGAAAAMVISLRSMSGSARPCAQAASSASSARLGGRPDRICTMRFGSKAKPSTRKNSSTPASDCSADSMIRKSGYRFSEKIMQQEAKAKL